MANGQQPPRSVTRLHQFLDPRACASRPPPPPPSARRCAAPRSNTSTAKPQFEGAEGAPSSARYSDELRHAGRGGCPCRTRTGRLRTAPVARILTCRPTHRASLITTHAGRGGATMPQRPVPGSSPGQSRADPDYRPSTMVAVPGNHACQSTPSRPRRSKPTAGVGGAGPSRGPIRLPPESPGHSVHDLRAVYGTS